jgi:hypothetical protein
MEDLSQSRSPQDAVISGVGSSSGVNSGTSSFSRTGIKLAKLYVKAGYLSKAVETLKRNCLDVSFNTGVDDVFYSLNYSKSTDKKTEE